MIATAQRSRRVMDEDEFEGESSSFTSSSAENQYIVGDASASKLTASLGTKIPLGSGSALAPTHPWLCRLARTAPPMKGEAVCDGGFQSERTAPTSSSPSGAFRRARTNTKYTTAVTTNPTSQAMSMNCSGSAIGPVKSGVIMNGT